MKVARFLFDKMTSLEHIFQCWNQFKRGKRGRADIQVFERHLEDNIFQLQEELKELRYHHAPYAQFYVADPKRRHISKAIVRDRLVHQAVYDTLTEFLDKKFIFHSFSSRIGKGTHEGVTHLRQMILKVSKNGRLPCFALKMDIQKFFDTIHHDTLKTLLRKYIKDENALRIIDVIIDSFKVNRKQEEAVGIPLGNVTSQLFANIYLHELDNFIKQELKIKYYIRFCDDFIILSNCEYSLKHLIGVIREFLAQNLLLELHPKKVFISKLGSGIDFLGYILFENHTLMRTTTKRRMKKRLKEAYEDYLIGKTDADLMDQKLQSYLGIISHTDEHMLALGIKNAYWIREGKRATH